MLVMPDDKIDELPLATIDHQDTASTYTHFAVNTWQGDKLKWGYVMWKLFWNKTRPGIVNRPYTDYNDHKDAYKYVGQVV